MRNFRKVITSVSRMEELTSNYYSSVTTCLALSRAAYAKDEQSCLVSEINKFSFAIV